MCFKVDGFKVYRSTEGLQAEGQYLFNMPIEYNCLGKFRIRIAQQGRNHRIVIGIADYEKHKNQRTFLLSLDATYYQTNTGIIPTPFFNVGDIIEVHVDRCSNLIKYFVNGVLLQMQGPSFLADRNRVFVPAVDLPYLRNCVEWIPMTDQY